MRIDRECSNTLCLFFKEKRDGTVKARGCADDQSYNIHICMIPAP